jgi:hypothetical protein
MKLAVIFATLLCGFAAHADSSFLVLTIDQYTYSNPSEANGKPTSTDVSQSYKIEVNDQFLAQFTKQPSANSSGTGFNCGLADGINFGGGMMYSQWMQPKDGKILVWYWAEGSEQIAGQTVQNHQGKAQVNLSFPTWQTIDTRDMISFSIWGEVINGMNVSFSTKSVAANDPSLKDAVLIDIKKADGSSLVKGEPAKAAFKASCSFQDN